MSRRLAVKTLIVSATVSVAIWGSLAAGRNPYVGHTVRRLGTSSERLPATKSRTEGKAEQISKSPAQAIPAPNETTKASAAAMPALGRAVGPLRNTTPGYASLQMSTLVPPSPPQKTPPASKSYRPIFFMHGITGYGYRGNLVGQTIQNLHPSTVFTEITTFEGSASVGNNMWKQVRGARKFIEAKVLENPAVYHDGFNLVCHSQGAILCRGLISDWDNHDVRTFVSMAGPQQGVDDVASIVGDFVPRWLYNIVSAALMYSWWWQDKYGFAGYFKDMRNYEMYRYGSQYLAVINNESPRQTPRFQANFAKLEHAVFLGSPADGVISPWQSSIWGYYAVGSDAESQNAEIVPYSSTVIGLNNLVPLQAMLNAGKAVLLPKDDVQHLGWLKRNETVSWYIDYL